MNELISTEFFAGVFAGLIAAALIAALLARRTRRLPEAPSRHSEEEAATAARAHALAAQQAFRVVWDRFYEKELKP